MRKLIVATIAVWLTATPGVGQAHVPKWHGPHTPGYMIINLRARVAHDKAVVSQTRGTWKPVGGGYSVFIRSTPDAAEVAGHEADLAVAEKSLRHYEARLGDEKAWECIHRFEGSWRDAGDPFWGGVQMDRGFMRTYGWDMIKAYGGFANVWSPLDQMIVAERARRAGRGYYPWPNTARYCGLI